MSSRYGVFQTINHPQGFPVDGNLRKIFGVAKIDPESSARLKPILWSLNRLGVGGSPGKIFNAFIRAGGPGV
jgi:hypothetical protein